MIITLPVAWSSMALAWLILTRTPEPDADDGPWTKPAYRSLCTAPAVLLSLVVSGVLAVLAARVHPWPMATAWALLAGAGAVLALCDLHTTYLPHTLMRPLTIATVLCVAMRLAQAQRSGGLGTVATGTAAAVLVATGSFWLLWRVGGGLGFGDVRLVAVLALDAGPLGLGTWYTGLLAGTVLGAVGGIAVRLWRRRRPSALGTAFAYGPALWLGAWVGLLATQR